jgi:pseudouridine synthase
MKKEVVQKIISNSGFCSRRKAEFFIINKKVKINGEIAELGDRASSEDKILVNNKKIIPQKEMLYIKMNKPKGYTCTNREFHQEKNVFDLIKTKEKLIIVGRLDKNSRGLVLLTNNGELAQKLTHPSFRIYKKYIVELKTENNLDERAVKKIKEKLKRDLDIGEDDGLVWVEKSEYLGNNKFSITLGQGKKRQIRRMFAILGYEIKDLLRTAIGNLELGDLKEGKWEHISSNFQF